MGIELRFYDGKARPVDMTDDAAMSSYMDGTHAGSPQASSSATELRYADATHATATLSGSFSYSSPGVPSSGTVTGVIEYLSGGGTQFTISGLPGLAYNPATWDTWAQVSSVMDFGVSVYGTAVADTLRGGAAGDLIYGNGQGDAIYGGDGNDSLYGGAGSDTLDAGGGISDLMYGGPGNDTYIVLRNVGDWAMESTAEGIDTVRYGGSTTSPHGNPWEMLPNIERVITFHYLAPGHELDPAPVHVVHGSAQTTTYIGCQDQDLFSCPLFGTAVSMSGGGGFDQLQGSFQDDTLNGGPGDDWMFGRDGDDTYIVDSLGDRPTEWYDLQGFTEGIDTIRTYIDYVLPYSLVQVGAIPPPGVFENLVLLNGAESGTGNLLANSIDGNGAHNVLRGRSGDDSLDGNGGADLLDGGSGRDVLRGGSGNDSFVFDSRDALVSGGSGVDLLRLTDDGSTVDLTLAAGSTLRGLERIDLTTGDHTLVVSEASVITLSDTDSLRIDGDAGDTLDLYGAYDSIEGSPYVGYVTLTSTTTSAVLYVDLDVVILQEIPVLPPA